MSSQNSQINSQINPQLYFDLSSLPIAQLESLKFKANQIIESIQHLQRTIEIGHQPVMPAWPDILSKYNILLSQTHSFSTSLITPVQSATVALGDNPYERIALHPIVPMSDTQLDNEVIPLLRNQQTTDVLKMENDTVRRLSEHMVTRGSVGVLAPSTNGAGGQKKPEYEDVLQECNQIKDEHDRRVERAVRAVTMLRDKFDWKQRVIVEVEEPEELDWDPRMGAHPEDLGGQEDGGDSDGEGGSSDEDEVEGALVNSHSTPAAAPIDQDQDQDQEQNDAPGPSLI